MTITTNDQSTQPTQPDPIESAVTSVIEHLNDNDIEYFKSNPRDDVVIGTHRTLGLWIRNNSLQENSGLVEACVEIDGLAAHFLDSASSIIVGAVWDRLNKRD